MPRSLKILFFVAFLGFACALGALIALYTSRPSPAPGAESTPEVVEYGLRILPFELTNQDGEVVDESLLEGEWTVVDFIFTNCVGACPVMMSRMSEAAERLEDTPVRFASFSLDQERDTPEALRAYAEGFGADFERWELLTGDDERVRTMVTEGLTLVVDENEDERIPVKGGGTMSNIFHPTRLFLVGPDLRVYEMYGSNEPGEVDRLVEDVRRYLAE